MVFGLRRLPILMMRILVWGLGALVVLTAFSALVLWIFLGITLFDIEPQGFGQFIVDFMTNATNWQLRVDKTFAGLIILTIEQRNNVRGQNQMKTYTVDPMSNEQRSVITEYVMYARAKRIANRTGKPHLYLREDQEPGAAKSDREWWWWAMPDEVDLDMYRYCTLPYLARWAHRQDKLRDEQ